MRAAVSKARLEKMENGAWFASIPGFEGLWATGPTEEKAREDLFEALDGWIMVHVWVGKERASDVEGLSIYEPPRRVPDE